MDCIGCLSVLSAVERPRISGQYFLINGLLQVYAYLSCVPTCRSIELWYPETQVSVAAEW